MFPFDSDVLRQMLRTALVVEIEEADIVSLKVNAGLTDERTFTSANEIAEFVIDLLTPPEDTNGNQTISTKT